MKEIKGDLWEHYGKPNTIVCITTNGVVRKDGACVMGRGCAKEAKDRNPALAYILGSLINQNGNKVFELEKDRLWSFPVKDVWWNPANLELIKTSAQTVRNHAKSRPETIWVIPRPGCGNGHLKWEDVKLVLLDLPDNVLIIDRNNRALQR